MKILISYLFLILAINSKAQFAHDHINYDQIFILKSGSISKCKVSDLRNSDLIEQQFGKNYQIQKQFAETEQEHYSYFVYDGLKLSIPENPKSNIGFSITGNKFMLQLPNGQIIKVGMTANEVKDIFPKSFMSRTIIENIRGQEDRIGVVVYFSTIRNSNVRVQESRIILILHPENETLQEFYTYEPS